MPDDSNNVNSGARASGTVDWSRPIEAVHEDGWVVSCSFAEDDGGRFIPMRVHGVPIDGPDNHYAEGFFDKDGTRPQSKWRIRNVQPTTPELNPALWDLMVALVRDMADRYNNGRSDDESVARDAYPFLREANSIVAALPKPVDPDVQAAADLLDSFGDALPDAKSLALAAIKRGRELATPEVSHVG